MRHGMRRSVVVTSFPRALPSYRVTFTAIEALARSLVPRSGTFIVGFPLVVRFPLDTSPRCGAPGPTAVRSPSTSPARSRGKEVVVA